MKILAFDASTEFCSAALLQNDEILERYELAPQRHSQLLLPMIDSLLAEAQLTLSQLDAIAFGRGPGSFTGLRIAASVAQGLAFACNLPVLPVSTLAALALNAYVDQSAHYLATIDARLNEVYYAFYTIEKINDALTVLPVSKETLAKSDQIPIPEKQSWIRVSSPEFYPCSRDIAQLAKVAYCQGEGVPAEFALPTYLYDWMPPQNHWRN